jgi:hypothetical protein
MTTKMEDIIKELTKEGDELFEFVKQNFIKIVREMGKPEITIPEFDIKTVFFLKSKAFEKTLLKLERTKGGIRPGSPIEIYPDTNFWDSDAVTLKLQKDKNVFHILVNCVRIKNNAFKLQIELRRYLTVTFIHEMIHTLEAMTGISIIGTGFVKDDSFSIPIYEKWASRTRHA